MEIKNAFNEPADGTFGSLNLHLALFIVVVWLNMRSVKKGEVQYEVMLPSVVKLTPQCDLAQQNRNTELWDRRLQSRQTKPDHIDPESR